MILFFQKEKGSYVLGVQGNTYEAFRKLEAPVWCTERGDGMIGEKKAMEGGGASMCGSRKCPEHILGFQGI